MLFEDIVQNKRPAGVGDVGHQRASTQILQPCDIRLHEQMIESVVASRNNDGVHASRDGEWLFVVSPRYAAWVRKDAVAEGARDAVLDYAAAEPYRLVTAAKVRTVYTPEEPRVSELQLDMGVRVPLVQVAGGTPVNGQQAYTSWPIRLPVRDADGSLSLATALLQKNADTAGAPLPLTRANIIRQAFKFLGERYGWGHDYNARDCSGFVSEVYRSMAARPTRSSSSPASGRLNG